MLITIKLLYLAKNEKGVKNPLENDFHNYDLLCNINLTNNLEKVIDKYHR